MADPLTVLQYVDYGAWATAPGPFTCADGQFKGLLVQGDGALLDAFIERVYNEPAPPGVAYRRIPGLEILMMLTGNFGKVNATVKPFSNMGSIREVQLSFWLPLIGGTIDESGAFTAERLVLAVPYIFVDNPMSYAGGREDYGYPKVLGKFSPETGIGEVVCVSAFGGNFGPGAVAGWLPFLEVGPRAESPSPTGTPTEPAPPPVDNFEAFINQVSGGRVTRGNDLVLDNETTLPADAVAGFLDGHPHQLFLKQFRDVTSSTAACLQQIVEVPLEITMALPDPFRQEPCDLTIHHLDSHPIDDELGVKSQQGMMPYNLAMSFNVMPGRIPPVPAQKDAASVP